MNYLFLAIQLLRPTAEFSFIEQDYSTVVFTKLDGNPPTQAEVDAAIEQVKADEITAKAKGEADKAALLAKLGITADEARLLLS
jgi:hypothetical protein